MTDMPEVVISGAKVLIGGQELPGLILRGGVHVAPGGCDDVNKLTVTFLVGRVFVEDPTGESDYAV